MAQELKRYFIELEPIGGHLPRDQETAARRRQASHYIQTLHHWLSHRDMHAHVYTMAITALGLVHITCTQDVISLIRHNEQCPIASIRQGAHYMDGLQQRIG